MIAETAEPLTGSVLNWVDLFCIALLGAFMVYGVIRGFVIQLLGILVLVGSAVIATFLSGWLGPWLNDRWMSLDPVTAKWIAFGAVFFLALVLGTAISHFVKGSLAKAKMLAYDRLLGGLLGLAKGWILAVVFLQVALNFTLPPEGEPKGVARAIINSRSGSVARWSTERLFVFLPAEMAHKLAEYDRLGEPGAGQ